jgi:uncharacterized protein (TIGR02145 family)
MKKGINFFTLMLLCSSLIITISSCNSDDDDLKIAELSSITIKNAPIKTDYYVGENLDLSGLIITLNMDNGESEDVSFSNFSDNGLTCSPADGIELTSEMDEIIITHTNSGEIVNQLISFLTLTDIDGNTYSHVKIGNQIWMAENLKTTHYRNGDEINDGTGVGDLSTETDPNYWFAYNDNLDNISTYGRLYTWYAVTDSRNICPDGWHVPTDDEWTILTDYLGGLSVAGGKLKETGTTHWDSPNTGATNETGFAALPGSFRLGELGFLFSLGDQGILWTASESGSEDAWYRWVYYENSKVGRDDNPKKNGFSVRCIKD